MIMAAYWIIVGTYLSKNYLFTILDVEALAGVVHALALEVVIHFV